MQGGKDGKKKKKTEAEEDLVRSPPEVTTIAMFHARLEELLEGEYNLEYQFTKALGEGQSEEDAKAEVKKKVSHSVRLGIINCLFLVTICYATLNIHETGLPLYFCKIICQILLAYIYRSKSSEKLLRNKKEKKMQRVQRFSL